MKPCDNCKIYPYCKRYGVCEQQGRSWQERNANLEAAKFLGIAAAVFMGAFVLVRMALAVGC